MAQATDAALWRLVDEILGQVDTLSVDETEHLRAPSEKLLRLRELHASCALHERQLRVTHLALLTEHAMYADRLLQLRRYCAARLQDASLPAAERSFVASMAQLTANLDLAEAGCGLSTSAFDGNGGGIAAAGGGRDVHGSRGSPP